MKNTNLTILSSIVSLIFIFNSFISPKINIDSKIKKEESFQEFLEHFEEVELPFEIGITNFKKYQPFLSDSIYRMDSIDYESMNELNNVPPSKIHGSKFIPESHRSKFSRRSPRMYSRPVAKFYPNERMVAIVFNSIFPTLSVSVHEQIKIIVYDREGNIISPRVHSSSKMNSKKRFRGPTSFKIASSSRNETTTCRIDKEGNIWKNTYTNIWSKDIRRNSLEGNQLVDFNIKETNLFQLNKDGVIEASKIIPSTDRASIEKFFIHKK